MAGEIRFGACLPTFGSCADRYVLSGYSAPKSLEELFTRATEVPDVRGVELVGNWHLNDSNFDYIRDILRKTGLEVCMMVPDLWTQGKWGLGTFTSKDPSIREAAIKEVKKVMDLAEAIGCNKVDLWFGQDGYDYCFQVDYDLAWRRLVEGVQECADHNPRVKVCIEYKLKEPRTHLFVNSAAKTLLLINEVKRDNVGALLDIGHSLAAQENVAEAIALLGAYRKLFYIHLNDNYRLWDDDLMVGAVHIIEYLEAMYWLDRVGYNDWYTLDIFPYREDGRKAAAESINWIRGLKRVVERIGNENIEEVLRQDDVTKAMALVRQVLAP